MQATKTSPLTKDLFEKLDKDRSGTIDLAELKEALGQQSTDEIAALMARADLNKDGVIDYAEYDRLMNMQKYSDEQGGNLYVRNAIRFGLLKPDSILADCVMVGNKGFDPLNCATSEAVLNNYREAELKHGRLAMLAAAGWPVSELVQPWLSAALRAPDLLATGEKAPSLLNGGLDKVGTRTAILLRPILSSVYLRSQAGIFFLLRERMFYRRHSSSAERDAALQVNPIFFMGIIIFSATLEAVALNRIRTADYIPGDLGFDPLRCDWRRRP